MSIRHVYKIVLRATIYVLIRPVMELFRLLSPPAAAFLGAIVGRWAGTVAWRERRKAERVLLHVLPDAPVAERRRIVLAHFEHLGRSIGEFLSFTRRDASCIKRIVDVNGMEHVRRAIDAGRGLVVLTSHFGSWELGAASVGVMVPSLAVVARDLYDPRFTRLICELRMHFNVRTIDTNDGRGILRHLKRGGVLAVLCDLSSWRVANVPVEFFGEPVATPVGPIKIAVRSGAALATAFITRVDGSHRVVIEDLAWQPSEAPAETYLREFHRRLERRIEMNPEQWVWTHDRWTRSASIFADSGANATGGRT